MNHQRHRSIDVLNRCLNLQADDEQDVTRQQRLDDLIAEFVLCDNPGIEHASSWHFCVPASFRAALDIKMTPRMVDRKQTMEWTQGSWFHFEEGDTIYDSPEAYKPWNVDNFRVCLDIRRASPARPAGGPDRMKRYPGTVIFDILTANDERTKLVKRRESALSQDDFVRLLIDGTGLRDPI